MCSVQWWSITLSEIAFSNSSLISSGISFNFSSYSATTFSVMILIISSGVLLSTSSLSISFFSKFSFTNSTISFTSSFVNLPSGNRWEFTKSEIWLWMVSNTVSWIDSLSNISLRLEYIISLWLFITSSYWSNCLRISKLLPSTRAWADDNAFVNVLLRIAWFSSNPKFCIIILILSVPKRTIKSSSIDT